MCSFSHYAKCAHSVDAQGTYASHALARLLHAFYTPLTRLLHASCTPVQGTYASHALSVHAFGVDTPATFNSTHTDWHSHAKLFEYVSVGMFAPWKRHQHIIEKPGRRLVVGYVC